MKAMWRDYVSSYGLWDLHSVIEALIALNNNNKIKALSLMNGVFENDPVAQYNIMLKVADDLFGSRTIVKVKELYNDH